MEPKVLFSGTRDPVESSLLFVVVFHEKTVRASWTDSVENAGVEGLFLAYSTILVPHIVKSLTGI